jgi:hypothetical protein
LLGKVRATEICAAREQMQTDDYCVLERFSGVSGPKLSLLRPAAALGQVRGALTETAALLVISRKLEAVFNMDKREVAFTV